MMNAEQLHSHVHVTHTPHQRIEGLRQRYNARLRDYASRHQSAQGPSLLAALASSAASAEEAARRPLALLTEPFIFVTAPLLLRGLRAATPQALHNALGHVHAPA